MLIVKHALSLKEIAFRNGNGQTAFKKSKNVALRMPNFLLILFYVKKYFFS